MSLKMMSTLRRRMIEDMRIGGIGDVQRGAHMGEMSEGRALAHWRLHEYRTSTTFIGSLTIHGKIAPFGLRGAINRDASAICIE